MSDINIDLIGDKELLRALGKLDQKTQQKELKKILRDTATQTFVKRLRQAAPPSQTLKKSYGHVTGKSRRVATIFAGPRMSLKKAFGEGHQGYKGWLANIIEFNKFQPRYPGRTRGGRMKKRPKTPMGVRKHSGVFPWGPFQVRTILNTVRQAEAYQATAVRKLIIKEFKKYAKR